MFVYYYRRTDKCYIVISYCQSNFVLINGGRINFNSVTLPSSQQITVFSIYGGHSRSKTLIWMTLGLLLSVCWIRYKSSLIFFIIRHGFSHGLCNFGFIPLLLRVGKSHTASSFMQIIDGAFWSNLSFIRSLIIWSLLYRYHELFVIRHSSRLPNREDTIDFHLWGIGCQSSSQ